MRKFAYMDKLSEGLTSVLVAMMEATDLKPSQLAKAVGVAPSTLNRVITADGHAKEAKWSLSAVTLGKLCERTKVSVTFADGTVFVTPEGNREFAKNADEIRLLRAWRALDPDDQKSFRKQLRGLVPPDKVDDILGPTPVRATS